MRWGREEQKPKQREKQQQQQVEKKHPDKQEKQQHQRQQQHNHQHRQQLLHPPPPPPQQQHLNHKYREQLLQPPPPQQQQQHRNHKYREQLLQPPPPPPQSHHHHRHQRQQNKEDRPHHQLQRQQDKEVRSSSSSTPFSLFSPISWISKLKHSLHSSKSSTTKPQLDPIPMRNHHHHLYSADPSIKTNKPDPAQPTSDHHHRRKLDKSAGTRPTTASPPPAGSKAHQVQPLSPTHSGRISSVSDRYISFLPADLDDGVFLPARRSYERMPGAGANGERGGVVERRTRGLSFDPFGSSSHADAAAAAVPELRRSESAKLTRIASDLTTASSPQFIRPDQKCAGAGSRRDEFSLFSAVPDTIRRINTTPAPPSSISTCTAPAAPRGSRLASDSAHQVIPEPRRRSFSGGTTAGRKLRRKSKLRVHSPRVGAGAAKKKPAGEVAEMPAHRKMAPATVGRTTTTATAAPHMQLESFAVVKCSSDPRRDFRDSMLEMISELGMARPDQLEGLLACYLSLNADEYHDVIVRVFRQVWLDLILDIASSCTSPPHTHQRASA